MLGQRLRASGRALLRTASPKSLAGGCGGDGEASILAGVALPNLRRKASNSWSAIQDTFFSTKEVFERHRVVFTVGTSIASVLTAWAGYSLRHVHQSNVERRLSSIEEAMRSNNEIKHEEIKKIVSSGNVSTAACIATAATSMVVGYGLGWRGGAWFARRKFRTEQLKKMGQVKQYQWQFLKKPLTRFRIARATTAHKSMELPNAS